MHQKQQPADLPQLTGLRGLAAFLVLFGHLKTPEGVMLNFGLADPFSAFDGFGVDIFVLSGFILCHVYANRLLAARGVLWEFYSARFARIYPLHLVTLFLMLGAYVVSMKVGVTPTESTGYTLGSTVLITAGERMVRVRRPESGFVVDFGGICKLPAVSRHPCPIS